MLIGSDGLGWIDFDDFELARQAGIVAVALILFEGGLSSGFDEIRPVLQDVDRARDARDAGDRGADRGRGRR